MEPQAGGASGGTGTVGGRPNTRRRNETLLPALIRVEEVQVRLRDDDALAKLLATIPHTDAVRPLLTKPFFGRRWDYLNQCDHWLASDGERVVCVMIFGAPAALISRMRMRFDELRDASPELKPSRKVLRQLLAKIKREEDCVS